MFQVVDTDTEDASHPGISAYQFMLEQNVGKTMLQFQVRVRERERVLITAIYLTQCGCQPPPPARHHIAQAKKNWTFHLILAHLKNLCN